MSEPIGGYLATPEKGAGPAVIVIPDGPEFCDRLAAEGFTALAPPAGELTGAIEFLKPHPAVRGQGMAVVGLGEGVPSALSLARSRPEDVVAVVVYSEVVDSEAAYSGIAPADGFDVPVQGHSVDDRESWIRTLEFLRKHLG